MHKYVSVFLALLAMSATFISCDRDNDITGDPFVDHTKEVNGKQNYWIAFDLSAGNLSEEAQAFYHATFAEQIYPVDYANGARQINFIEHPIYESLNYVTTNFNKVKTIPASENDLVQKVMLPVAKFAKTKNFDVTMTLSKDSMKTVIDSYTFVGAEVLANVTFDDDED